MTGPDLLMWISAGLALLTFLVALVCEGLLFFDPKVKRTFPFGPYIIFTKQPIPSNRVSVRRAGMAAGFLALFFGVAVLVLDLFASG